jgi:hypothetical protein
VPAQNLKERRKFPLNAIMVVSDSPQYPEISLIESPEGKAPTAAELIAGLSRDMERIELALRKLMLLR